MPHIVFFHGLESGPHGSKFHLLDAEFEHVISPDFSGVLDILDRLRIAEEALKDIPEMFIVGSSFGGLLAAMFADKHPDRVLGYVLCAPAVHLLPHAIVCTPPQAVIIHGDADTVVPLEASRVFAANNFVTLKVVADDHSLSQSSDVMVDSLRAMV